MRALILLCSFVVGSGAGALLGFLTAAVFGLTSVDPPSFPGGNVTASALALGALVGASVLARRAGSGIEEPHRARAEGRSARNSLLLAAAFSAFAVVFAVFAFARVPPLSLLPSFAVAFLLALAVAWRAPLLRLAAICVGVLYALAGLAVSLAKAF